MTENNAAQAARQQEFATSAREWAMQRGTVENFPVTARAHILNLADALLSKLRAPVAPTTDRAMLQSVLQDLEKSESVCPRCGHSDSCADMDVAYVIRDHLKGDASAPVADERAVLEWYAEHVAGCRKLGPDGDASRQALDKDGGERARSVLASAPVAGEAKNYPGENVAERLDKMADDQPPGSQAQSDLYAAATIWRKHIAHRAAPQASAEYERGHADGWAAGWDQAIKQPQADKDGGQQRAGDELTYLLAENQRLRNGVDQDMAEVGRLQALYDSEWRKCKKLRAAFDHPVFAFLLGEGPLHGVHFGDRHPSERGAYWWRKDLRAALSAPQAEQGERDA